MANIKTRSLSRDLNRKGSVDSALFGQLTHGRAHEFVAIMGDFGLKLPVTAAKGQKFKDTFVNACRAVTGAGITGTKHEKAAILGAVAVAAGLMAGTVEAKSAPDVYTAEYVKAVESLTPAKTEAQIAGALKAQATREAKKEAEAHAAAVVKNLEIVTNVTALQICEAIQSGRFSIDELQAIADSISTQADIKPV